MFGIEFPGACLLCGAMVFAGFSTRTSPILANYEIHEVFAVMCLDEHKSWSGDVNGQRYRG